MKAARIDVDEAYRTLVNKINALIIVNGEAPYVDFVNKINQRIEAYTNNLSIYKGKAKTTAPAEVK